MGVYVRIKRAYLWHGYRKGVGRERREERERKREIIQGPSPNRCHESREKETRKVEMEYFTARIPFCINTIKTRFYNFNKQHAHSLHLKLSNDKQQTYKELSFLKSYYIPERERERNCFVVTGLLRVFRPFFLFFFSSPPSPRENDLFNRSESVVIEQFKRRANWSRFSGNDWPINNPGRGWFLVVVNLFPSMAVQEPGECQGQHSRYHWPPAITPEALSWVRLRSHIRPKRNAPTARYRYLG